MPIKESNAPIDENASARHRKGKVQSTEEWYEK